MYNGYNMSSEVLEFIKKHNLKIQDLANVAINSKKPFEFGFYLKMFF